MSIMYLVADPACRSIRWLASRSRPAPSSLPIRTSRRRWRMTMAETAIQTCKSQGYNVSANVVGRDR